MWHIVFMRILIATKNRGKFNEIEGVLKVRVEDKGVKDERSENRPGFEIFFLGDFKVEDRDFIEDGLTHEENARKKAKYYYEKVLAGEVLRDGKAFCFGDGGLGYGGGAIDGFGEKVVTSGGFGNGGFVIGEDSGIYVDALRGELGVQTRRWGAGENTSDEEWLEHFMKVMGEKAPNKSQRSARFVCYVYLVGDYDGKHFEKLFEGETKGIIVREVCSEVLPGLPLSSVFLPEGYDKVYAALSTAEKNKISHRGQAMGKVRKFLVGQNTHL